MTYMTSDPVADAGRHSDECDNYSAAYAKERERLYEAFLAAFERDPEATVETPGFARCKRMQVGNVIVENIDDAVQTIELMHILRRAMKTDPAAKVWLGQAALRYAEYHTQVGDDE